MALGEYDLVRKSTSPPDRPAVLRERLRVQARRSWWSVRGWLGTHPRLFLPVARWWDGLDPEGLPYAVTSRSEAVIEGPPRSGNTFAVEAFRLAQRRRMPLGHHTHQPAQVLAGVRRGIPVMVMLRDPAQVAVSIAIRWEDITPALALKRYIRWYETVLPHRSGFVVAPFEEVVEDFSRCIERLNRRFGTTFEPFEQTQENVDRCFAKIEADQRLNRRFGEAKFEAAVARPSAERDAVKARVAAELEGRREQRLLARARDLYARMRELAGEPA
jgi:hypothetical protein